MQKIILKDNAVIYIDEFDYNKTDGKCRLYDSNKEYMNYLEEDGKDLNDYLNYIKSLQTLTSEELAQEIIEDNNSTYYIGKSVEEVLEDYKDYLMEDEEFYKDTLEQINFDLKNIDKHSISLNSWEINQIGNVYFIMF